MNVETRRDTAHLFVPSGPEMEEPFAPEWLSECESEIDGTTAAWVEGNDSWLLSVALVSAAIGRARAKALPGQRSELKANPSLCPRLKPGQWRNELAEGWRQTL